MTTIEFAIPISPSRSFLSQVRVFAESLRRLGEPYNSAVIHVCLGADCEKVDLESIIPWSADYPLRWHWVERSVFLEKSYSAQAELRFDVIGDADVSIFCDADVVLLDRVDEFIEKVQEKPGLVGTMAFSSPFAGQPEKNNEEWWAFLAEKSGVQGMNLNCSYPLPGIGADVGASEIKSPPYLNYGFVGALSAVWRNFGAEYDRVIELISGFIKSRFFAQVALTITCYRLGLPISVMDQRFNFPNLPLMERSFPDLLADVRVAHYAVTESIDRDCVFVGREACDDLIARNDLTGVNALIQGLYLELRARQAFYEGELSLDSRELIEALPTESACHLASDVRIAIKEKRGPYYLLRGAEGPELNQFILTLWKTHLLGCPNDQLGGLRESSRRHWPEDHPHAQRCRIPKEDYLENVLAESSSGNGVFGFWVPDAALEETVLELSELGKGDFIDCFPGIKAICFESGNDPQESVRWLNRHGIEKIVVDKDEFRSNPRKIVADILEFLGVPWSILNVEIE